MQQTKNKFTASTMAMVGVIAALVFAASWISVPIPTPIDNTRLHLGNIMCLLSGFILGPIPGGLAAGFGSMFFDLTNPLFINEAPITFITKFLMAWLCGLMAKKRSGDQTFRSKIVWHFFAAACGALFYVMLYLTKNFINYKFFLRMEMNPILLTLAQKGVVSLINAIIAIIASVPLYTALKAALARKSGNVHKH